MKNKEKTVLRYIDDVAGACSSNEISKATGISYITVQKYLKKFEEIGIIISE